MFRHVRFISTAAIVLAAALSGCQATTANQSAAATGEVNFEGLATVPSRRFDLVQLRPQTNLGAYSRIVLQAPELAYRTPDRAAREFPVTEEQKDQFRSNLVSAFNKEFADLRTLELVDEPGPATLALDIRVEDIVMTVAPSSVGRSGRAAALLEASGDAVIVIELRDSQSNEILARGVNSGAASGGALRTPEGELRTRFDSSGKIVEKWAAQARAGLENLLSERR
jgi:hypothetical protein